MSAPVVPAPGRPFAGLFAAGLHEATPQLGMVSDSGYRPDPSWMVALSATFVATIATVLVLGWILVIDGIFQAVMAFWSRRWSGFFLHVLAGVLTLIVGFLMLSKPCGRRSCSDLAPGCLLLREWILSHRCLLDDAIPKLGLGALERRGQRCAGGFDLVGMAAIRPVGDRFVRRYRPALLRLVLRRLRIGRRPAPRSHCATQVVQKVLQADAGTLTRSKRGPS